MNDTFEIRSRAVVLPEEQAPRPATIHVRDGKIGKITAYEESTDGRDVGERVIMPGIVDTHVHLNEPGRTEWEGFETATRAAAAGGITLLVDMPLNCVPPTTTVEALALKRSAVNGRASVDYGFWGGVVPGNEAQLKPLVNAGVFGCKAFLIDSGVEEFPMVSEAVLRESMSILAEAGSVLLAHAELHSPQETSANEKSKYDSYLASRPEQWELDAIRLLIRLSEQTKCRVHIVHLSAASALPEILAAKNRGVKITVETCPHYLALSAEEIKDGETQFKCAPPIRSKENAEKLWAGLANGTIDFVVSDHSPCTPALKRKEEGDFFKAWGGIAGLQFGLSVMWTQMKRRGFAETDLSRWMSARPADFLGLKGRKGEIRVGADADLVVWDPASSFVLAPEMIYHRHPVTPYLGKTMLGKVSKTFVRGICVFDEGQFSKASGQEVVRQ